MSYKCNRRWKKQNNKKKWKNRKIGCNQRRGRINCKKKKEEKLKKNFKN